MIKSKDRSVQFVTELKALLKKWDAEIKLEDVGRDWRSEYTIKCYINSIYKDGDCIAEWAEVDLGSYEDGN